MREMKDSGVEWIGEIPEEWDVMRLKYILMANDGGIWGNDPKGIDDKIIIRSTEQTIDGKWDIKDPACRDLSGIVSKDMRILPGDLLITKSSGSTLHIGKTTLADDYFIDNEFYFSNFLQRLRVSVNPKFIWYVLNIDTSRAQFAYMQNSTSGIGNINSKNIEELIIVIPPLSEQRRIADFLDAKCAEIDALTEDIRSQIDTLEQYKRSVITEAVTKGLNPDVEMKDSGIEWIGEIPAGWKTNKTKYCFSTHKNIVGIHADDYERLALTMQGVIKRPKDDNNGLQPEKFETYQILKKHELVFKLIDLQNVSTSRVGLSSYAGIVSPAYIILSKICDISEKYAEYYYLMLWQNEIFNQLGDNGVRSSLNAGDLLNVPLLIPPLPEQQAVADYLDRKCAEIDGIIDRKREQLAVLEDYKKSLIFEYVTGKKEVPVA